MAAHNKLQNAQSASSEETAARWHHQDGCGRGVSACLRALQASSPDQHKSHSPRRACRHRGERYFEVDVDISSSYAAAGVVNIVKGATKSMVIDFGDLWRARWPPC